MKDIQVSQGRIEKEAERILWVFLSGAAAWGAVLCYIWVSAAWG